MPVLPSCTGFWVPRRCPGPDTWGLGVPCSCPDRHPQDYRCLAPAEALTHWGLRVPGPCPIPDLWSLGVPCPFIVLTHRVWGCPIPVLALSREVLGLTHGLLAFPVSVLALIRRLRGALPLSWPWSTVFWGCPAPVLAVIRGVWGSLALMWP